MVMLTSNPNKNVLSNPEVIKVIKPAARINEVTTTAFPVER